MFRGLSLTAVYRRPRLVSVHRNFPVGSNKWKLTPRTGGKSVEDSVGEIPNSNAQGLRQGSESCERIRAKIKRELILNPQIQSRQPASDQAMPSC
jgi:hypothetical protein